MERWEVVPMYVLMPSRRGDGTAYLCATAKKMTVQETQTPEGKPFRKQGEHPVPTQSRAAGGMADLRWGKGWGQADLGTEARGRSVKRRWSE